MYKAFDHFQIQYQYSEVPLATLMKFPATHFLQSLPSDYWLRRYPKLTASTEMKIFWSATMLLPARNLWYRVLSNKVPHGLIVHLIKIIKSSTCVLCREAVDDFKHFVFYCRVKADIWYNILQARFPSVDITLVKILPTLCSLELPSFIPLNDAPHYYTIVSTIQYGIWLHYWKQSIDQIPFDPTKVQLYIDTQLDILLTASFND